MRLLPLSALACVLLLAGAPAGALAGDVKAGMKVFKKCMACHEAKKEKNRVGPHLVGILGRKAGIVPKFRYSKSLKAWDGTWTEENLDVYLEKPRKLIPKGRMAFAGLKKKKDRDNLIAYLKTL